MGWDSSPIPTPPTTPPQPRQSFRHCLFFSSHLSFVFVSLRPNVFTVWVQCQFILLFKTTFLSAFIIDQEGAFTIQAWFKDRMQLICKAMKSVRLVFIIVNN